MQTKSSFFVCGWARGPLHCNDKDACMCCKDSHQGHRTEWEAQCDVSTMVYVKMMSVSASCNFSNFQKFPNFPSFSKLMAKFASDSNSGSSSDSGDVWICAVENTYPFAHFPSWTSWILFSSSVCVRVCLVFLHRVKMTLRVMSSDSFLTRNVENNFAFHFSLYTGNGGRIFDRWC